MYSRITRHVNIINMYDSCESKNMPNIHQRFTFFPDAFIYRMI